MAVFYSAILVIILKTLHSFNTSSILHSRSCVVEKALSASFFFLVTLFRVGFLSVVYLAVANLAQVALGVSKQLKK